MDYPTGITQNVEYLLDSVTARTMLSNSEFIVMNNQAASDRTELAKLLNISEQSALFRKLTLTEPRKSGFYAPGWSVTKHLLRYSRGSAAMEMRALMIKPL